MEKQIQRFKKEEGGSTGIAEFRVCFFARVWLFSRGRVMCE